ncbi:MAG: PilZ domain-containing protein [Bdellovibrionota bacterium]
MKSRPKSLLILVAAFAFVPILNIIATSFFIHIAPHLYLWDYLIKSTFEEKLGTFIVPWLAAYSLYVCKKWSYVLFAILMGVVFAQYLETALNYPSTSIRLAVAAAALSNMSVLIYLAFSENHQLFVNPSMRWWETPSRYRVSLDAEILAAEHPLQAKIKDLSMDGLFLETPKPIEIGVPLEIAFSIENLNLAVKAIALRRQATDNFAYGMMIEHTPETRSEMKHIISTLKTQGVPTTHSLA